MLEESRRRQGLAGRREGEKGVVGELAGQLGGKKEGRAKLALLRHREEAKLDLVGEAEVGELAFQSARLEFRVGLDVVGFV